MTTRLWPADDKEKDAVGNVHQSLIRFGFSQSGLRTLPYFNRLQAARCPPPPPLTLNKHSPTTVKDHEGKGQVMCTHTRIAISNHCRPILVPHLAQH